MARSIVQRLTVASAKVHEADIGQGPSLLLSLRAEQSSSSMYLIGSRLQLALSYYCCTARCRVTVLEYSTIQYWCTVQCGVVYWCTVKSGVQYKLVSTKYRLVCGNGV